MSNVFNVSPENGLSQTDRLGMRFSVESRQPFVNHQFIEKIINLRSQRPDHDLPAKALLKDAQSVGASGNS